MADPEAMADLLLALVSGVSLGEQTGGGFQRSDGMEVFTEDVLSLKHRQLLRETWLPSPEGKDAARRGREWLIEIFSQT